MQSRQLHLRQLHLRQLRLASILNSGRPKKGAFLCRCEAKTERIEISKTQETSEIREIEIREISAVKAKAGVNLRRMNVQNEAILP